MPCISTHLVCLKTAPPQSTAMTDMKACHSCCRIDLNGEVCNFFTITVSKWIYKKSSHYKLVRTMFQQLRATVLHSCFCML